MAQLFGLLVGGLASLAAAVPSAAPTSYPTGLTINIAVPTDMYASSDNSYRFEFTTLMEQYQTDDTAGPFDFLVDVLLVDTSGNEQGIVENGRSLDKPFFETDSYVPDNLGGSLTDGNYRLRILEYNHGYDVTSDTFFVHFTSATPSGAPTLASAAPSVIPTPSPTTDTLTLTVLASNADYVDHLLAYDEGDMILYDDTVDFNIRYTGTSYRIAAVTLRLCYGDIPESREHVTNPCVNSAVTIQVGEIVTSNNAGIDFSTTFPVDSVQSRSNYFFTVQVINQGTTLMGSEFFTTGSFAIQDARYAPTLLPTSSPTLIPTSIPTLAPTFSLEPTVSEPTYSPTSCTIVFEMDPQEYRYFANDKVTIRVATCEYDDGYSFSYDYGIMDILLYSGDTIVDTVASYERLGTSRDFEVKYQIPATMPDKTDYKLRAIEYSRGLDVYSDTFSITNEKAVSCVVIKPQSFEYGGIVLMGSTVMLEMVWGDVSTWPSMIANIDVSVYLCRGSCSEDEERLVSLTALPSNGATVSVFLDTELDPSDKYKFLAVVHNDGIDDDIFTPFLECASEEFSIQAHTPTSHPTSAPTTKPTVSPTPVPTTPPTMPPTGMALTFHTQPFLWVAGETYEVQLDVQGGQQFSFGYGGVVDVLLYGDGPAGGLTYVAPTATIAAYLEVHGESVTVHYNVPVDLPPASTYQLRAIEYTRGLDVYSDEFEVVASSPTPAPTAQYAPTHAPSPAPSSPGLRFVFAALDGLLVAGETVDVSVELTGGFAAADDAEVSLYLCGGVGADGLCDDYLGAVAHALYPSTVAAYVPSSSLAGKRNVFFEALLLHGHSEERIVFHSSTFDIVAAETIQLAVTSSFESSADEATWLIGSTQEIHIALVGYGDATAYVDVYIYAADDETLTPIQVLASGAEMNNGMLDLEYVVPSSLPAAGFNVRVVEYKHGHDARSGVFVTEVTYEPSFMPSYAPTRSPTTIAPTRAPTIAPTVSTLAVTILDSATSMPPSTLVANATELDIIMKYTGSLSHNVGGFATVRLCAGNNDDGEFNGPATLSAYSSCNGVYKITYAAPLVDGELELLNVKIPADLGASEVYIRVDSMADRASLGDWAEQWNAYGLVYTSNVYEIEHTN